MEPVSLVFPLCNEANSLEVLYHQVVEACGQARVDPQLVFVDDGSTDQSLAVIKQLRSRDPRVVYVSLSRNFGHQNALVAGMTAATGSAVITMDADLQHPPSLLPQMIALWREGIEVVYTTKREARLPPVKAFVVKLFYRLLSRLSGLQFEFGQSDFRLLDRKVADVILGMPEYHKFLRGQVKWVGFSQRGLAYDVEARHSGESKFTYRRLFGLALDGLLSFSRYPLRLVTIVGTVVSSLSVLYVVFIIGLAVAHGFGWLREILLPPGWATLAVSILFLGSMQVVVMGVLAEYLGRVYEQTKGRPNFIIRERSDQTCAWPGEAPSVSMHARNA